MKTLILSSFFAITALSSLGQNVIPSFFRTASVNSKCGPLGDIKMFYSGGCPGVAPTIDSIYSNGKKSDATFASPDVSGCNIATPLIKYCLTSGKIPSGTVYEVYFRNPDNTTFKGLVPCNCAFALPVTFTSFTASVFSNTIVCNWNTENEIDNSHFIVERSEDGRNFSGIATIEANNSGKYQATDNKSLLAGKSIVYYRVKQVDYDGSFSYSNILTVRLAENGQSVLMAPNPFKESLSVSFVSASNGNAEIRILNLAGQVTASKRFSASKGNNNILVDGLGRFNSGIYMIQLVINGSIIKNQKLVKQ